ncbi:hypothetical protein [Sporomusa termitida]|uniref:hypothetical protein n=1 Tax=Sporomusa termitida TaxID=2377 RepID=UPI001185E6F8|nr:hypothetical protein [Sporomusa termitida]
MALFNTHFNRLTAALTLEAPGRVPVFGQAIPCSHRHYRRIAAATVGVARSSGVAFPCREK